MTLFHSLPLASPHNHPHSYGCSLFSDKLLAQLYLDCSLEDEGAFKSKIIDASKEAMIYDNSIEYFYHLLYRKLDLEQNR